MISTFGAPFGGRSGTIGGYAVSGSFASNVVSPTGVMSGIGRISRLGSYGTVSRSFGQVRSCRGVARPLRLGDGRGVSGRPGERVGQPGRGEDLHLAGHDLREDAQRVADQPVVGDDRTALPGREVGRPELDVLPRCAGRVAVEQRAELEDQPDLAL